MTECVREGLPRVGCMEMRCGLLTSSTRCLHTGQWARPAAHLSIQGQQRHGHLHGGQKRPHRKWARQLTTQSSPGARPEGLGLSVMTTYTHVVSVRPTLQAGACGGVSSGGAFLLEWVGISLPRGCLSNQERLFLGP